jgi:hypothetical protein
MSERQRRRQKSLRQERGGKNRHQSNIQEHSMKPRPTNMRERRLSFQKMAYDHPMLWHNTRNVCCIAIATPQLSAMQFPSERARRRRRELAGTQELASRCVLISLFARHNISFPLTPPSFTYVFTSSFTYLQGSWSNFIYPSFPHFFSFLLFT